jgi:opacity protein-like surface antigen
MKKLLYTSALLVILSVTANAQLTEGNIILGGDVKFTYSDAESGSYRVEDKSLSISPQFGWMVNDKIAFGFKGKYEHVLRTNSSYGSYTDDQTIYGLSTYLKVHNNITEKFLWYYEAELGMSRVKYEDEYDGESDKIDFVNAAVNVGIMYFVTTKLSIDLGLFNINYSKSLKNDKEININDINFGLDLVNPKLGIKFYL